MATEDWIDIPKGLALGSSLVAFVLVLGGVAAIREDNRFGWLLLVAAAAMTVLAWRLVGNYIRGGRTDRIADVPAVDAPTYVEPPSNVKRIE